ncbi:MAG: hypothetical protein A2496_07300, partial [Burkholderiales bacterium RIFOXYC12_FULL_60_6]
VGGLLILAGATWFLQGIGVLPGSYMTGQSQWAIYGGLALLLGIGLVVFANRRRSAPPRT